MHHLRQPVHQLRPQVAADGFIDHGAGILPNTVYIAPLVV
jgi:hypothetical protein